MNPNVKEIDARRIETQELLIAILSAKVKLLEAKVKLLEEELLNFYKIEE